MRLADEDIVVSLGTGGEVLHLRATLRAATRLEHRYGGFGPILRGVANAELGVIAAVLAETSVTATLLTEVLEELTGKHLHDVLQHVVPACAAIVLRLSGCDEPEAGAKASGGARKTYAEYHAQLYRIATGWLGWTPEAAWAASPAEIVEAHRGRIELLGIMFGTRSGSGSTAERTPDFERDPKATEKLRKMVAAGFNRPAPASRR